MHVRSRRNSSRRSSATAIRRSPAFAGDSYGRTYFADAHRNAIDIIDSQGIVRTLSGSSTALSSPQGITVDPRGRLYITNSGNDSVTVYLPGAYGNARPRRAIAGGKTTLKQPLSIAVDQDGTVHVFSGPQEQNGLSHPHQYIAEFAPGAAGDVDPRRVYAVEAGCFTDDHL